MKGILKKNIFYAAAACAVLILIVAAFASYSRRTDALSACPCRIFTTGTVPVSPIVADDSTQISFGIKFSPMANGYITGVRFYKDPSMTGTHTGSLWNATGSSRLETGTFTNETASGWQDLVFSSPVAVTAGTNYVASMYTPIGKYIASANYFTSPISNYPLSAPTGAGVFHYGGDAFPSDGFNNGNYWIDATFKQTIGGEAPTVTAVAPTNGATNSLINANVTATLSQNLNPSTISTTTVKLTDSHNNDVAATVTYADSTKTITLDPTTPLADNSTYTASLHGGAGGIENLDGTVLASDYQWSFTTGTDAGPSTVWNNAAPTGAPISRINSGGETFGQVMHANENGYLQAVRFYKPLASSNPSHTVRVWTQSGTLLASATSSHETSYGWQEVQLPTPLAINQGQNYVVSFYAPDGAYVYSLNELATEKGTGAIRINASSSVFISGSDAFPTTTDSSTSTASLWIDAVFTTASSYTAPFTLSSSQPKNNSIGVSTTNPLEFIMSNPVDATTLNGSLTVKTSAGANVAGALSYNDAEHTISFTPTAPLATNTNYVATILPTLKDTYGTAPSTTTVNFATGGTLITDINQGMGGPVLALTSAANPYSTYLAEMLRAQGINYFDVKDIAQISSSTLANYKLVLLGKAAITTDQVSTLTTWVQAGGNLIAMQPDKKLAPLLGITDQSSTLTEGYLKVDSTVAPGKGITPQTMQYHYAADVYSAIAGTQTVATLYTNATTPTTNPAVTNKVVGSGHAAAFMYDLPKSIALTHQGNPASPGQDRDGNSPIRPNDLFNGNGGTDWLNTAKAYIPQADEQQRLLTNLMTEVSKDTPLPSYWMLPHGYKTAMIMIEDDHSSATSTYEIFDEMLNTSATNCSVADWECNRSGSLLYTDSGLTSNQANKAYALGFDMGNHINVSGGCGNYANFADLNNRYVLDLAGFQAKYTGLPPQTSSRSHCYVWSDWDSTAKADIAHGIQMNFNYEWYPPSWAGTNKGYLTGSGMTMRFTDTNGALLNDYQGVTDLDYETDPTNASVNAILDNALNSNEFYGVIGTHYDSSDAYYRLLITAARARNIPMIHAQQMITWKNALGSSNFTNITSTNYKLNFTTKVGEGGQGMQAMIPASTSNGALTSLKIGATNVAYTTSTVKGVDYAVFDAAQGDYEALYGTQPVVTPPSSGGVAQSRMTNPRSTSLFASITNPTPFTSEQTGAQTTSSPATTAEGTNKSSTGETTNNKASGTAGQNLTLYIFGAIALLLAILAALIALIKRRRKKQV